MRDSPAVLSAGTQMVSRNHTVANDGTDNDDLDEYTNEINRGVRPERKRENARFFRESDIYARPRAETRRQICGAQREIRSCVIRGELVRSVDLNWITRMHSGVPLARSATPRITDSLVIPRK